MKPNRSKKGLVLRLLRSNVAATVLLCLASCDTPQQAQVTAADQSDMARLVGNWPGYSANGIPPVVPGYIRAEIENEQLKLTEVYGADLPGYGVAKGNERLYYRLQLKGRAISGWSYVTGHPEPVVGNVSEDFRQIHLIWNNTRATGDEFTHWDELIWR